MPNDAQNYCCLARELNTVLAGARITKITTPDPESVLLALRVDQTNHFLLCSASPARPRMHLTSTRTTSGAVASGWLMHLRKHIGGGIVRTIRAERFERVMRIEISALDEMGSEHQHTLVTEIMARNSNILLLDQNGHITDCQRKVPLELNSRRVLLPGVPYALPPVGDKVSPDDHKAALSALDSALGADHPASAMVQSVQGLSVPLAEYIMDSSAERMLQRLLEMFDDQYCPAPCLVRDSAGRVKDFGTYCPAGAQTQSCDTLSQAMDAFFLQAERDAQLRSLQNRAQSALRTGLARQRKKLDALKARMDDCQGWEQERLCGDLILASIYRIRPGDDTLQTIDYNTDQPITIALDAHLSPSQNAQRYYKRSAKKSRTLAQLTPQIDQTTADIAQLESVQNLALDQQVAKLEELGLLSSAPADTNRPKVSTPREYQIDGFVLLVGRNNRQNDELVRSARPDDIWLHIKDAAGCHGVIRAGKRKVEHSTIVRAAAIIVELSLGGRAAKTPVDFTHIKYVTKPKGSPPGKVVYTHNKTIWVQT